MVEMLSPLGAAWKPATHANAAGHVGVVLSEPQPGSIVQVACWTGKEAELLGTIRSIMGLSLSDGAGGGAATPEKAAFGFAPGKYLVVSEIEGLADSFSEAVPVTVGTVTDLSHGRTAIRVAGAKAEWVLAKFFALDFSPAAFPVGKGVSTAHHDIFAQIQRTEADSFDLYVFRSFARAFWTALCHASAEVGYEVR